MDDAHDNDVDNKRKDNEEKHEDDEKLQKEYDDAKDDHKSTRLYKAPMMMATSYESTRDKEKKREERERRRLMQSSVLQEMKAAMGDGPDEMGVDGMAEVAGLGTNRRKRRQQKDKEIQDMEEDLFIRFVLFCNDFII